MLYVEDFCFCCCCSCAAISAVAAAVQNRNCWGMENRGKIDFHLTFVFCSVHDPDAIKTAGEPALLWATMAFCVGLFGGRICDVPPRLCDCGCAAEIDKIMKKLLSEKCVRCKDNVFYDYPKTMTSSHYYFAIVNQKSEWNEISKNKIS